jgi:hypothetical protein
MRIARISFDKMGKGFYNISMPDRKKLANRLTPDTKKTTIIHNIKKVLVEFTTFLVIVILLRLFFGFSQDTSDNQNQGINLNFSVHDIYLAAHTLRSKGEENFSSAQFKDDIVLLQKYMEGLSKEHYDKLMAINPKEITPQNMDSPKLKDLRLFIIKATETSFFGKILSQTYEYGKAIRNQWQKNYPTTLEIMKEVTGLPLNKTFTVFITHPSLKNRLTLQNDNAILWGNHEEWDNFSTVYLWHEVMNTYLPQDDVSRAVLELLCENHLRVQLNGGDYPPLIDGTPDLKETKEKILADWKAFLHTENKDILNFITQTKQKLIPR